MFGNETDDISVTMLLQAIIEMIVLRNILINIFVVCLEPCKGRDARICSRHVLASN